MISPDQNHPPINLSPFLSTANEFGRHYLLVPLHFDQWTLATNGHVAVAIPRLDGSAETMNAPLDTMRTILQRHQPGGEGELPLFTPPEGQCCCRNCLGSGYEDDMYEESALSEKPCPDCAGNGKEPLINQTSVEIEGTILSARYLELIRALPFPKLCYDAWPGRHTGDDLAVVSFVFDGGIGLLMPMRHPHDTHVMLARPGAVA